MEALLDRRHEDKESLSTADQKVMRKLELVGRRRDKYWESSEDEKVDDERVVLQLR